MRDATGLWVTLVVLPGAEVGADSKVGVIHRRDSKRANDGAGPRTHALDNSDRLGWVGDPQNDKQALVPVTKHVEHGGLCPRSVPGYTVLSGDEDSARFPALMQVQDPQC
ncbi:hypothetical protein Pelo_17842 [Pelomyxa schiedti]|nr:hypothetical protein Pelo_17842 [Pelomyxa schiedti]